MALFIDTVDESAGETDTGEPGQTPGPTQEPEPLLGFGGRSRVSIGATEGALDTLLRGSSGSQRA